MPVNWYDMTNAMTPAVLQKVVNPFTGKIVQKPFSEFKKNTHIHTPHSARKSVWPLGSNCTTATTQLKDWWVSNTKNFNSLSWPICYWPIKRVKQKQTKSTFEFESGSYGRHRYILTFWYMVCVCVVFGSVSQEYSSMLTDVSTC